MTCVLSTVNIRWIICGVRKVLGHTLYNQKLLNILNKISFQIFDSHIKKDRKGKNKLKDAYIPIKNLL